MNIYIQKIQSICLKNKYTKWYCNIIQNAIKRGFKKRNYAKKVLGYVEKHHILPKSFEMGGEKDKLNLVFLTAKEHYICHLLLAKMVIGQLKYKMVNALFRFFGKNMESKRYSRYYKTAKQIISKNHPNKTEEARKRTSLLHKGKVMTDSTKLKIGESVKEWLSNPENHPMFGLYGEKNPNFGKTRSDEAKHNMSISSRERWSKPEEIMKASESQRKRFKNKENHPFNGKSLSDAHKKNIGDSLRGTPPP